MTTGAVVRAAAQLGLVYALIGVVGTVVLALLSGGIDSSMWLPAVVLAVSLFVAAAIVVVFARIAVGWLEGRIREPATVAIMLAAGLVLLSGVLTVPSLGGWAIGLAAVMALATHLVLTREWT